MDSFEPPPLPSPVPLVGLRGRQRIPAFSVARPGSVADAVRLRGEAGSVWMAGGIDLVDEMKHGLAVARVIPLSGLDELRAVTALDGGGLRLGALVTYQELAEHPAVLAAAPALAALMGAVANIRIRSKATVGGSIMSRNGAYDLMPALLALGATLVFDDAGGSVHLPAEALEEGERRLLRAVELPGRPAVELRLDRSLRPSACVFLGLRLAAAGVAELRLATSCTHPRPACAILPLNGLPPEALAQQSGPLADALLAALPPPVGDGVASAGYRRRMIGVLAGRLLSSVAKDDQP